MSLIRWQTPWRQGSHSLIHPFITMTQDSVLAHGGYEETQIMNTIWSHVGKAHVSHLQMGSAGTETKPSCVTRIWEGTNWLSLAGKKNLSVCIMTTKNIENVIWKDLYR